MKRKILIVGLILGLIFLFSSAQANGEKDGETIIFQVKVAADQYYRVRETWQEDLRNLIEAVNQELKSQRAKAGLEIVEILKWEIEEEIKDLDKALDDLIGKVSAVNCDLVIALTGKSYPEEKKAGGKYFSYDKMDYILVKDYPEPICEGTNKTWTLWILLHDLGHFLGLDHSKNPKSIMNGEQISPDGKFLEGEVGFINENAVKIKNWKSAPY